MNVLVCNERFLFRFGMDRALVRIAGELGQLGHHVTLVANQCDRAQLERHVARVLAVEPNPGEYLGLDDFTRRWIERSWDTVVCRPAPPDVVLVGGWPFFSAIPFFRGMGAATVFVDFGAVPTDGYADGALRIQELVRDLRRRYVPDASLVIAISDFIARSQSRVDAAGRAPVRSVLLGADHVDRPTWSSTGGAANPPSGLAADTLDRLARRGCRTILALGRWEAGCYKNSEAAFDVLDRLRAAVPECVLLVLEQPDRLAVPDRLRDAVVPIGFPDDVELADVMRRVDLGISVSRWEGFNLPLAEMQWLERPALAFDVGAHPEVVVHPWFLCRDLDEMTGKARDLLAGRGPDATTRAVATARFRNLFRWRRVGARYAELLAAAAHPGPAAAAEPVAPAPVIVDTTNATRDPANTGVMRVTRRIARELQRHTEPLFAVWDETLDTYVLPTDAEYRQLAQFNGPRVPDAAVTPAGTGRLPIDDVRAADGRPPRWLLLTETLPARRVAAARRFARRHGLGLAAIFYDAIPVLHPELCNAEVVANHAGYMKSLADCDVVLPISEFSGRCLRDFWTKEGLAGCPVRPNPLAGEFGRVPRSGATAAAPGDEVRILCVSTLEPRKNLLRLVDACRGLDARSPGLNWSLTLVGNRYAGAFDIAEKIAAVAAADPRIWWPGVVDDQTLHRLYREASFTVYPSLIEGFGMPVLESLWHGKPCICSVEGALGEIALHGGCVTVDVTDASALAAAIHALATDAAARDRLAHEAATRPIKRWDEYTSQLLAALEAEAPRDRADERTAPPAWEEILYPGCRRAHWQMNDSERMAMTALLARHRPRCAIEVGTYEGGSLSLLSQYAAAVFSIDIDPAIPGKLGDLENVSFLTGASSVVLPLLLKELDAAGMPVDFVLVDGDHTADGVKGDIQRLLAYVPTRPLFLLVHDSFNPDCRRGMLEVDWARSPHVQWVDLDFVPGRLVEDGGPFQGQLWGGLALAYLSPARRRHALEVRRSADEMFAAMRDYASRRR